MNSRQRKIDMEIAELLKLAAEHNRDDYTVWMAVDAIAFAVMDRHTRGARRLVRQRLLYMLRRGEVEQRNFDGVNGWKIAGG